MFICRPSVRRVMSADGRGRGGYFLHHLRAHMSHNKGGGGWKLERNWINLQCS